MALHLVGLYWVDLFVPPSFFPFSFFPFSFPLHRYHVTLLGVRGREDQNICLNPGLDHIMHTDDTVYYIGFTREEYSKVGGASHIHTALWEVKWVGPHTSTPHYGR